MATAERPDLRAPVVAGGNSAADLQSAEHDLDPVAAFVAALVVFDGPSPRYFRPGIQGFFNASLNQSAS